MDAFLRDALQRAAHALARDPSDTNAARTLLALLRRHGVDHKRFVSIPLNANDLIRVINTLNHIGGDVLHQFHTDRVTDHEHQSLHHVLVMAIPAHIADALYDHFSGLLVPPQAGQLPNIQGEP